MLSIGMLSIGMLLLGNPAVAMTAFSRHD